VIVLELVNEQTALQQETARDEVRRRHPLYAKGGYGVCERHLLTRPKVALQRALLPALEKLEGAQLAVAMHVRTGFADWQKYRLAPPRPPRHKPQQQHAQQQQQQQAQQRSGRIPGPAQPSAAGMPVGDTALAAPATSFSPRYTPASHAEHWAEFERLLRDCRELNSTASFSSSSSSSSSFSPAAALPPATPPMCFLYKMGPPPFISSRSTNARDAARCALSGEHVLEAIEPPSSALRAVREVLAELPAAADGADCCRPLAATVACAALHARVLLRPLPRELRHHLNGKAFIPAAAAAAAASAAATADSAASGGQVSSAQNSAGIRGERRPPSSEPEITPEAHQAREQLEQALLDRTADARWRLIILGDAPALHSLLEGAPYLRGRAVTLESAHGAGELGHTVFDTSCRPDATPDATDLGGGDDGSSAVGRSRSRAMECVRGADPRGAWTRSIADLYLGGLAAAMVRLLFSTYPGAVTMRSVMVSTGTQFYADYHRASSHRDKPPSNLTTLDVLAATGPYRGAPALEPRRARRRALEQGAAGVRGGSSKRSL
jgi:hypothetical protein